MFTVPLENITDELLLNSHPGTHLRLDYMPDMGITEYRLAKLLGISQTHVRSVLRAERSVTAALAIRLGKLFNQSPEMWLGLQADYDLLKARRELGNAVDTIQPFVAAV